MDRNRYLKQINLGLDIVIAATIGFVVLFAIKIYLGMESELISKVSDFMDQNIPLGNYLFNMGKQYKIIDLSYLIQTYIKPLGLVDIAIFTLPFLFLQTSVFLIKRRMLIRENAVIAAVVAVLLLFAMLMTQGTNFSLLKDILGYDFSLKFNVLIILLGLQLLLLLSIIYLLWKLDRLNIKSFLSYEVATRLVKLGCIPILLIFLVLFGGLKFVETQTDKVRDAININFEIDLVPKTDGLIHIEVPPKVQKLNDYFHFNIPSTIDNTTILKRLGLETIDIGAIINSYTLPRYDSFIDKYVKHPIENVVISLIMISSVLILEIVNRKKQIAIIFAIEGFIACTMFVVIPNYFPTILFFLNSVVLAGVILHLVSKYHSYQLKDNNNVVY